MWERGNKPEVSLKVEKQEQLVFGSVLHVCVCMCSMDNKWCDL